MLWACAGLAAHAQTPPRTPEGRPDFHGAWHTSFITDLERPDGVTDLVVTPEQAREVLSKFIHEDEAVYDPDDDFYDFDQLARVNGTLRTSFIVQPADGKLPFNAAAKAANDAADKSPRFDNPEERPVAERCVGGLGQAPIRPIAALVPNLIVQTAGNLVVMTEDSDSVRIIHLNGQRPPAAMRSRAGHSTGRWDGDTLVIETTHLASGRQGGAQYRGAIMLGPESRIIERLTLLSDSELLYQFTVEDPAYYERPWLAEYVFNRYDGVLYEYACHESNYSMTNVLRAARLGRQKEKIR